MATIAHTVSRVETFGDRAHVITWTPLDAGDVGSAVEMPGSADRSVQIFGTFGGSTTVMQGSNDGTNWGTLNDPQGSPISMTVAQIQAISELTRFIRPSTSGGTPSGLTVTVLVKR